MKIKHTMIRFITAKITRSSTIPTVEDVEQLEFFVGTLLYTAIHCCWECKMV